MHCEFCENDLPAGEPANLALLQHVEENDDCRQRYAFMLENIGASWTPSMSGG